MESVEVETVELPVAGVENQAEVGAGFHGVVEMELDEIRTVD